MACTVHTLCTQVHCEDPQTLSSPIITFPSSICPTTSDLGTTALNFALCPGHAVEQECRRLCSSGICTMYYSVGPLYIHSVDCSLGI